MYISHLKYVYFTFKVCLFHNNKTFLFLKFIRLLTYDFALHRIWFLGSTQSNTNQTLLDESNCVPKDENFSTSVEF